ncbi:MAG: GNAT family N-acetyltransferase [Planctomycetaceae bacterium]|jgi:ribosomal protein S18 acetylase RimI-like enzyme|nr:GNAT family N-acetyltransferase [Planctomycetaceae bacterium]
MWSIRPATINDIDSLVDFRVRFLEEIGYGGDGVAEAVRDYLLAALPRGEFVAWLAEEDSQIVATGGLVFQQKAPHAKNLSGREGFVLNMYTLPAWRGRGIATALMRTIVRHVGSQGIPCIRLHTSKDGVGIYTRLGFRADSEEMVLHLAD